MTSDETYFITGFPGFITNRLLLRLAITGGQFLLLVQPALVTRAKQEIARIVSATGSPATNFHIVEGDISQPGLGMTVHDLESLRLRTTRLFHLAAIYDLGVARDLALSVNVAGTQHVNELARSLPHLRHYHHVSTCYVSPAVGSVRRLPYRRDCQIRWCLLFDPLSVEVEQCAFAVQYRQPRC